MFKTAIDNAFSSAIIPFKEIAAYEALWLESKASFKTIANLFRQNPGRLPSELIHEEFYKGLYPELKN